LYTFLFPVQEVLRLRGYRDLQRYYSSSRETKVFMGIHQEFKLCNTAIKKKRKEDILGANH